MKKYLLAMTLSVLLIGACSKKDETPVQQKEKTESTINSIINEGTNIEENIAVTAISNMPDDAPIEDNFPGSKGVKSGIAATIAHHIPLFKRNLYKAPLDSIYGTWQYVDSLDEWQHISNEPQNGIVLIWDFADSAGTLHTAKAEFTSISWYNDTLITEVNINLYVDDNRVAYLNYDLTIQNNVPVSVSLDGAIVGVVEFSIDVSAASGHNLEEDDFYGTVHISFRDLTTGESFVLDVTSNEDGSSSFKFVYNDGEDNWEFYWTVSAPNATGVQTVSGYIKENGTEVATIEGTLVEGDFSGIYIVYADGTRVSISEYLSGISGDTGTGLK